MGVLCAVSTCGGCRARGTAGSALYVEKDENGVDIYTYIGSGVDENINNLTSSYDQYLNASYNNQNPAPQTVPDAGVNLEYWDGETGFLNTPVTKTKTIYKVKYASGYNSRSSDISRIRCVYRSGLVSSLPADEQ